MRYDAESVAQTLRVYYEFIAVVDDAIDSFGLGLSAKIASRVSWTPESPPLENARETYEVVSDRLRAEIPSTSFSNIIAELNLLLEAVIIEDGALTFAKFIDARERVGRLTASVSYHLIEPSLDRSDDTVEEFMSEVGAIGCLVDSLIDFRYDVHRTKVRWHRSIFDWFRLVGLVCSRGRWLLYRYPTLVTVFLGAVLDNFLDRFTSPFATRHSASARFSNLPN